MTGARDLTLALGGIWHEHSGQAACPVCQPERRADQRALALRDEGGRMLVFCHKSGCGFRDVVKATGMPAGSFAPDPLARRQAAAKQAAYGP